MPSLSKQMLATTNSLRNSTSTTCVAAGAAAAETIKRKTLVDSKMELNATSLSNKRTSVRDNNDQMTWIGGAQEEVATSKAIKKTQAVSGTGESPGHHFPHHGQRPSLAGFDPFLTNEQYTASSVKRSPQKVSKRTPSSPLVNVHPISVERKTLQVIRVASPTNKVNKAQTIVTPFEKRAQDNTDCSPVNVENDARQPPSPIKYRPTIVAPSPSDRNTNTGTPYHKREKIFSFSPQNERTAASPSMSGGGKLLSFVRKGHRRSMSLEGSSSKIAPAATQDSIPISTVSEPNLESSNTVKSGIGIVQDLMDLKDKFIQLQIPTLAKPSPTSFLTGKGDEAVRTSYYEPSPFQMEIPSLPELVEVARLNDFVENYRRMDQNFDMNEFIGQSRLDIQSVTIKEHQPIAQSMIECGEGLTVQGFLSKGTSADDRLEAVVFEGQRYFVVVFRGTTEQQTKLLGSSKTKRRAVALDSEQDNVEVYCGFKEEYSKLEHECFTLIDKLTEQNPFCDVVFSGFSFGAAMATLSASRYAVARPMMRVACFTLASPKVGFSLFRHVVNSLPNLKVFRLELGQDAKCQGPTVGGWHVGHTLVLSGAFGHQTGSHKMDKAVLAYKFDTPKHKKFKTTHPDLRNYITTLEEMARLNHPWVTDFANASGKGVVVNNEARQVV
jgi:hypothetical protein